MTHYEVLGVKRSATDQEIRAAYRKLALTHHPDRNADGNSHEKFIQISEAYEVLKTPARRTSYDRLLDMGPEEADAKPKARPKPKPKPQPSPTTQYKTASYKSPGDPPLDEAPPEPETRYVPPVNVADDLVRLTGYMAKIRFTEAERLARKIIRAAPREAIPYAVLGDITRSRGELKDAAGYYAYAAQLDPSNPGYQRRYEDLVRMMDEPEHRLSAKDKDDSEWAGPLLGGILISAICVGYLAISNKEPRPFTEYALIDTWTVGLVVMLIVTGLVMGAALSIGKLLGRAESAFGTNSVRGVQPAVTLAFLAAINFWLAALLYALVGATQSAYNASTSRLMGAALGLVLAFSGACLVSGHVDYLQTLAWGGNVVYLAAVVGWMLADTVHDR